VRRTVDGNSAGETTTGLRRLLSLPGLYNAYDTLVGNPAVRRAFVQDFVRAAPGANLLELGCGTAKLLRYLTDVTYTGIDISEAYIRAAWRRYGSRARFVVGSVTETNFGPRHSFDIVMAFGLLHHLDDASAERALSRAKEALKPAEVLNAQAGKGIKAKAGNRRKNAAYVRQGEWFFIPAGGMAVDEKLVLANEPLSRGAGSKPHWAEFCYRMGGETVYVCAHRPNGVTLSQYKVILARKPKAKGWGWRTMLRDAAVYVKGRIRHADHATITLHGWHRVLMNTEGQSKAMRNVAFLD